ncbi:hypothetical protein F383_15552 [Gossypium arboreum]|uniref:Uncharacterized protein n=2 Tax=Gossypium arboreum TaxID=29729 RepID=A0ABR0R5Z7_GOSAR|nr:E3 ubiquitin-protein ligase SIRP1-like [Gossypium arboreum]XP_017642805.1 E3 ubiquitin-protein ligase SIRP1-like [Gossypium arboreum]KAK5847031.1 hypothetical protein PVK06_003333 [Gossypium arboreum]KHG09036.1 hypothetical protein F383_15552 [Gossypium arboreum]
MAARYWCYQCSQVVTPIMEAEIKCPFCRGGFIEEMSNGTTDSAPDMDSHIQSDRALSLWAPILLGMLGNPRRRRRLRRIEFEEEDAENSDGEALHGGDTDLDRELESIIRNRRRNSASIVQLLQGVRERMVSEGENSENDRDRDRDRDRDGVIFINPFNQTIIVQGSYDSNQGGQNRNSDRIGSIGDYFIGPGLDILLQHLAVAQNDPERYGTPPAQVEAIMALPTVKIEENLKCCVCMDDFEAGSEAREMPCKHKFHSGCILPWLEIHSSCPVCRYQIPAVGQKLNSERPGNNSDRRESESNVHGRGSGEGEGEGDGRSGRRFSFPWPFNGLFTSGSQSGRGNSSSSTASSSQSRNASQTNEN